MQSYIDTLDKEKLLFFIKDSKSLGECVKKMGMSNQNANRKKLKIRLEKEGIKTSFLRKYDKDLIGYIFGPLVVIDYIKKSGKKKWLCLCECGNKKEMLEHKILNGTIKSCGCKHYKRKEESHFWKGCKDIPGIYFYNLQKNAKNRDYEFLVTKEYLADLYIKQNKKCALSNLPIEFSVSARQLGTASLDRIDNTKGYIEGNLWWVHKDINKMKSNHKLEDFIKICKAIVDYANKIN